MTPRRISIVGNSGSGKSTAARRFAEQLGFAHLELDSLRHQAGWVELPDEEFARRVIEFTESHDQWVVDGNYRVVQPEVWKRADAVVWLDLPFLPNMWNIVTRTLARTVMRRELWNGNREPWTNLFSLDPYRNIVVWAWTRHPKTRTRYRRASVDPRWRHLDFISVRSRAEFDALLGDLTREDAG